MEKEYGKLVRDKIPDIIRSNGATPFTHIADSREYSEKLRHKLQEEVDEFIACSKNEELADILEVVYALGEFSGASRSELDELREKKAKERGAFKERIILDRTK